MWLNTRICLNPVNQCSFLFFLSQTVPNTAGDQSPTAWASGGGFRLWHNLLWAHCPNWQTVMWVNCRSNYDPSSLKTKLLLLFYFYFSLDFDCSWWTVYFEKLVKNRSSVNHAHARARRNKRERDEKKKPRDLKFASSRARAATPSDGQVCPSAHPSTWSQY